jgi:hypothetical protein
MFKCVRIRTLLTPDSCVDGIIRIICIKPNKILKSKIFVLVYSSSCIYRQMVTIICQNNCAKSLLKSLQPAIRIFQPNFHLTHSVIGFLLECKAFYKNNTSTENPPKNMSSKFECLVFWIHFLLAVLMPPAASFLLTFCF